jgi:hypothetical protein
MKAKYITTIVLILLVLSSHAQTIRYVKPTASGTGNGSSWANASGNIQGMINASAANDQVWVAVGNFQSAAGQSYSMKDCVKIYGHFAGTETLLSQRNLNSTDTTFLSGSGSNVFINGNNGVTNTALLDGFTLRNGTGSKGGAILNYCSAPNISHCVFINNTAIYGGALSYNNTNCPSSSIEPTISYCTFINNYTIPNGNGVRQDGGAIFAIDGSKINIDNCNFFNNTAYVGGAIAFFGRYANITNSIIANNYANYGGWVYLSGNGQANLINTILLNNSILPVSGVFGTGGGLYCRGTDINIINCLLPDNFLVFNKSL